MLLLLVRLLQKRRTVAAQVYEVCWDQTFFFTGYELIKGLGERRQTGVVPRMRGIARLCMFSELTGTRLTHAEDSRFSGFAMTLSLSLSLSLSLTYSLPSPPRNKNTEAHDRASHLMAATFRLSSHRTGDTVQAWVASIGSLWESCGVKLNGGARSQIG